MGPAPGAAAGAAAAAEAWILTGPGSAPPVPTVHRITQLRFVNAYLVEEDDGLTLVDTLTPSGAPLLLAAAQALGRSITRIAITHGHLDHVGSLDAVRVRYPDAEVTFGRREAKLIAQDFSREPGEPATPRWFNFPKVATTPDWSVEPGDRIGSLRVHDAAGHTPGQIAFSDVRDGTLYCGDALHSFGGGLHATDRGTLRFPFPSVVVFDKAAARRTARELAALSPARVAPGHGQVIESPAAALERAVADLRG